MSRREQVTSRVENAVQCQGCEEFVARDTTHFWPRMIGIMVCRGKNCSALYADSMLDHETPVKKR